MSDQMALRPKIHYTPKKNWMNDPNGCVYHKGTYHLFYQYNPFHRTWGSMHWGHASSDDLVSWQEHEPALKPDMKLGEAFSGSAVIDARNDSGLFPDGTGMIAFYTSHKAAEKAIPAVQHQCLAYSTDEGTTWLKYDQNPVIHNPGIADFRDPKVLYHEESSAWIMLVAAGTEIWIYRSENLKSWKYCNQIQPLGRASIDVLECPDMFPLVDAATGLHHWVLVVSLAPTRRPNRLAVKYLVGSFDGFQFNAADSAVPLDHGGDFYAPQSWNGYPLAPDKQVLIAWANNWAYANHTPTAPWRGMMTLPRELFLHTEDGQLILLQKPVMPREATEIDHSDLDSINTDSIEIALSPDRANSIVLKTEKPDEGSLQIVFVYSDGEELKIEWDGGHSMLTIDRKELRLSGFNDAYPSRLESVVPKRSQLELEIILDISILEVFINHGERVFTCQVFPESTVQTCMCSTKGSIQISGINHREYNTIFHN
jgi:sucrose-6-phosphate hydrolase SacC (GH32 family)